MNVDPLRPCLLETTQVGFAQLLHPKSYRILSIIRTEDRVVQECLVTGKPWINRPSLREVNLDVVRGYSLHILHPFRVINQELRVLLQPVSNSKEFSLRIPQPIVERRPFAETRIMVSLVAHSETLQRPSKVFGESKLGSQDYEKAGSPAELSAECGLTFAIERC